MYRLINKPADWLANKPADWLANKPAELISWLIGWLMADLDPLDHQNFIAFASYYNNATGLKKISKYL